MKVRRPRNARRIGANRGEGNVRQGRFEKLADTTGSSLNCGWGSRKEFGLGLLPLTAVPWSVAWALDSSPVKMGRCDTELVSKGRKYLQLLERMGYYPAIKLL